MKNTLTIIKKEFARFFKDTRLVITTLLLPGLMIYLLYSFIGSGMYDQFEGDDTYVPIVHAVHMPDSIAHVINVINMDITMDLTDRSPNDINDAKSMVENKNIDLLIVFPENFDALVEAYDSTSGERAPHIEIYYNSVVTESMIIYTKMVSLLNAYESIMINKFDINFHADEAYDLATPRDVSATIFSMLLPFLILIFLFSGCMAVAPESIAGEKERGTIATLLVTPIRRRELALGKMISLSVISTLAAISSFLGTALSLPKLMGSDMGGVGAAVYEFSDYALLFLVILVTVLLMVGLISILSAFASSVKEATTLVMPLMIVVMLIGITSMFGASEASLLLFLVPIYNSVIMMTNIFSFNFTSMQIILTLVSNVIFAGIAVYILTRMFNSEKIMFSK